MIAIFLLAALSATFLFAGCSSVTGARAISGSDGSIVLSGTVSDGKADVTVRLKENCGINKMVLILDYDTTALTLTGMEQKDALRSMSLITTNPYTEEGYGITPFSFDYQNVVSKDSSTGVMFVLHFSVKKNAKVSRTAVGLTYEEGAILTLDGGKTLKRSFSVTPALLQLR